MSDFQRNEEAICHAIVELMGRRLGMQMSITERPDKVERQQQAVEMLFESPTTRYALEHTQIESFPNQIRDGVQFAHLLEPLERALSPMLPGRFTLTVPVGSGTLVRTADQHQTRLRVAEWILRRGPQLSTDGPNNMFTDKNTIAETPPGIPFPLRLHRRDVGEGRLLIARFVPDDLEALRLDRVTTALARKCPKLARQKAENRSTVLVFESNDIALGDSDAIGKAFGQALSHRSDPPDHVFLVETEGGPWYVWTLKEGADTYPCQRLVDLGSEDVWTLAGC